MDDRPLVASEPEKHISERAEEIWRARVAKGIHTSARQLAMLLVADGYTRLVSNAVVRNWIAGWMDDDGIEVDKLDNDSPEGALTNTVEILAGARVAISEQNLGQIYRGLKSLVDVTDAVAKEMTRRLPEIEIRTVDDLRGMVDMMDRLATCQQRMSEAVSVIDSRKISASDGNGRAVQAEILAPDDAPYVPPHARDALQQFKVVAGVK